MVTAVDSALLTILAEDLVAAGGAVTPAIGAELDALPLDVAMSDALIDLIVAAEAEQVGHKAAAAPHFSAALAAGKRAEELKEYLRRRMEATGIEKLEGPRHRCRLQTNSAPKISWPGKPETIPADFQRTKIELDPAAAKLAYGRGTLPEGFVVDLGIHLRIVG